MPNRKPGCVRSPHHRPELLTTLCARLSADTRINFSINAAGFIEVAASDAFRLAAFLELGYIEMANEACRRMEW
jgi:hypothetical protein